MTFDICKSRPGDLTDEMLHTAPELMSAWARNPYATSPELTPGPTTHIMGPSSYHGKMCALTVERLLKRLVDERRAGNTGAVATTEAYNAAIAGWACSGEKGAAQRAEQILISMQDMFASGETNVQPDLESFRSVLVACSSASVKRDDSELAALRAQRVLEWMVHLHNTGKNDLAKPDAQCFELVLHSWAFSGRVDAPKRVEELLLWMEHLYSHGQEQLKPKTAGLNQVLMAWSRSGGKGSAQRAHDILQHMERVSKNLGDDDIAPNGTSYGAVVYAWAKSGEDNFARKAESVLRRMEERYIRGATNLRPYTGLFNVVIDSFAKTNDRRSYQAARAVLDRQIILYEIGLKCSKPDVYGYTSVISSCASTAGPSMDRLRAFNVAESTFLELCRSDFGEPNHVTYGTMLKACAHLLPRGSRRRTRITKELFSRCCQDGCVGDMVLARLREAASPSMYKKLMEETDGGKLPPEWTRNIPQSERRHKKRGGNKLRKT
eukprot:CAMPEP_0183300032 /NCGR_PEP_ID=MMETSP0160_2-20130417/6587_1 /TAXON_ID=2839 ORGANISM="Odontella Sinensis, Strain Grunow 1884" /NCGR_SAMPLE_ID=MMETSP0160_2 /ASSEMBLY_ACC=CAM_ASM_000250 /LENGTH=492 /DNA_ID=CAMNT_0025462383 /DNA_START=140 /DNA_END=1618 /DNA_ORIENTATION=+